MNDLQHKSCKIKGLSRVSEEKNRCFFLGRKGFSVQVEGLFSGWEFLVDLHLWSVPGWISKTLLKRLFEHCAVQYNLRELEEVDLFLCEHFASDSSHLWKRNWVFLWFVSEWLSFLLLCRRKRGEKGEVVETVEDVIVRKLTAERVEELKKIIKETQEKYRYMIELLKYCTPESPVLKK